MTNRVVVYRWCIEHVSDEEGRHYVARREFIPSLSGLLQSDIASLQDDHNYRLALVRSRFSVSHTLRVFSFLYAVTSVQEVSNHLLLPVEFYTEEGNATDIKVPKRFHAELKQWNTFNRSA